MIILKFREFNNHGQEYDVEVRIDASTKAEVDEILDAVENKGLKHPKYKTKNLTRCPAGFGTAGGFCSDLMSATDENGKDCRKLVSGWY